MNREIKADSYDGRTQRISLVVVGECQPSLTRSDEFLAGVFEVVEIAGKACSGLGAATARDGIGHHFRRNGGAAARRLNIGISLSSGDWVVALFGDESLAPGWAAQLEELLIGSPASIHVIRSDHGPCLPLIAIRRTMFAYGALDEGFPAQRLCLLHWLCQIYGGRQELRAPGGRVAQARCEWLGAGFPPVDHSVAGLIELWDGLVTAERAALLEQALSTPGAVQSDLERLMDGLRRETAQETASPYRSDAPYDPMPFWESNTAGYVRWEAYQPDEPEIIEMVDTTSPKRVLELGCGVGRNARYFTSADIYVGIDIARNLLVRAGERLPGDSAGTVCGDVARPCFAPGSFDLVFSDSTLQHVTPTRVDGCVAGISAISSRFICLIEFTDETDEASAWFDQAHMFRHDYARLFAPYCRIVGRQQTRFNLLPAKKEVLLFEKAAA